MFTKLCKYEFKSIARTLTPIYLAVIAISIINAFLGIGSFSNDSYNGFFSSAGLGRTIFNLVQTVSSLAYFGVLVALSVLTLIVIIQRFYKGLLSDEGYLMFTLPVKPWQLISAKGVAALVMSFLSSLTALLSIFILVLGSVGPAEFFQTSAMLFERLGAMLASVPSWPLLVLELIVVMLLAGLAQLYHMYFSMALGHLGKKHRVMMSVAAYIAISMALNFIFGLVVAVGSNLPFMGSLGNYVDSLLSPHDTVFVLHLLLVGMIVASLLQLVIFFFGTDRILTKRLNLE